MLFVIAIESILFGLMGFAIFRVSLKMKKDYDRTAVLWILSFVMGALGARLLRDMIVDGSQVEVGNLGTALAGSAFMFGTLFGVLFYAFMLATLWGYNPDNEDADSINA